MFFLTTNWKYMYEIWKYEMFGSIIVEAHGGSTRTSSGVNVLFCDCDYPKYTVFDNKRAIDRWSGLANIMLKCTSKKMSLDKNLTLI